MAKNGGKITTIVRETIAPTVEEMGFSLWDIEYKKIGADYHLTITIDKADGVSIDDCEAVHRAIDPLLDEVDPIDESYYLDVSSPGIEREIRTKDHYLAMRGTKIKVKLFTPVAGKKEIVGVLSCNDDVSEIVLTDENGSCVVPLSLVSRAHVYYEF